MKKIVLLCFILLFSLTIHSHAADFWVDVENGSNDNSGLTPDDAWNTITYALTLIDGTKDEPATIHVAKGIYRYDMDYSEIYPLNMKNYVTLVGEDKENTILDGRFSGSTIISCTFVENFQIKNLTLTGGTGNCSGSGS